MKSTLCVIEKPALHRTHAGSPQNFDKCHSKDGSTIELLPVGAWNDRHIDGFMMIDASQPSHKRVLVSLSLSVAAIDSSSLAGLFDLSLVAV